jgi:glycosyltransferase involved in cell wall biosynthesis
MKIALLSRWYWEENHRHEAEEGGPVQQLAEAVAALGHEVIVLSQSPRVAKLKKVAVGKLETWVGPRERRRDIFTALRDKWAKGAYAQRKVYSDVADLRDFLRRRGPFDVLWAQTESPDGLIAALAARQGVKLPPVLVQVQDLRQHVDRKGLVFTERVPLGLAFRHATRILANSELVASHIGKYAARGTAEADVRAKTHVVYPNIQRAFFRAAEEAGTWPKPLGERVLFLGALNFAKGALVFLNAVGRTQASKRNSIFAIIGGYTENNKRFEKLWEAAQEDARKSLLGARTEYLGYVTPFEVIRQIKLARVVVIPSLFDAFSRAVVEALALGRPVITTDRVGAAMLVKEHDCGVVVPPNNPAALARAIDVSLSPIVPFDKNAQKLAHRLVHDFSPEAIALQLSHHLAEIATPAK